MSSDNNTHNDSTIVMEQIAEEEDLRDAFERNLESPVASNYSKFKMDFQGTAPEYYKIWFVNLMFSILSLGIYSAWAKIRKQKYLYSHTYLNKENFDYHAKPIQVLKGRAIIFGIYLCFMFLSKYNPEYTQVLILIGFLLLPWFVVRVMTFKLRNTSYQNIRFGFNLNYKGSYAVQIKSVLANIFSLGLASLWGMNLVIKFIAENSRFGKTNFIYFGTSKPLYRALVRSILATLFMAAVLSSIAFMVNLIFTIPKDALVILPALIMAFAYIFMFSHMQSAFHNNKFNHLRVGPINFRGTSTGLSFFYLNLGNFLIILFSLGLAYPVVTLRNHRFKIENTRLRVRKDIGFDGFAADNRLPLGATSEAAGDFWDIDIGV